MKTTLVGYTGFVGSNLASAHRFDRVYNSRNIVDAFTESHDLVIYAGMRAEKFLANSDPAADKRYAEEALNNIRRMAPKKLVLISTVDVYKTPNEVDETTPIDTDGLHPYGYHRYLLEEWVKQEVADCHILRLPGLFGKGMKKNFIYDMMTLVPSMLKKQKYEELVSEEQLVARCYQLQSNGFFKLCAQEDDLEKLRNFFESNDFNSLSFTDSRAVYQFYDLRNLWADINTALENDIRLLNISSEPVSAAELFRYVRGTEFINEISPSPVFYDWRSVHAEIFGGSNGYIYKKDEILSAVRQGVLSRELLKKQGE